MKRRQSPPFLPFLHRFFHGVGQNHVHHAPVQTTGEPHSVPGSRQPSPQSQTIEQRPAREELRSGCRERNNSETVGYKPTYGLYIYIYIIDIGIIIYYNQYKSQFGSTCCHYLGFGCFMRYCLYFILIITRTMGMIRQQKCGNSES